LYCHKKFVLKQTVCFSGGEAIKSSEYTDFGRVTEFKYGTELGKVFRGKNPIKYLKNFGMSKTYSKLPIRVKLFIDFLQMKIRTAKLSEKHIAF
jgi:hypothetical protein